MNIMERIALPSLLVTWAIAGCGHGRMLPGSAARVVPGAPSAAVAEDNGVRVAANGDDWSDRPEDLPDRLTPVKVRIVNKSGRPIRILYESFALTGARGRLYRPLPLIPVQHQHPVDSAGTLRPIFAAANFFVAPRYHDIYPSLPAWSEPLPRDPDFSQEQYRRWHDDLPTREMQRLGLPEGVLGDGGQISGFLYFENVTGREARLTFDADLDDGQTGVQVALIEIPFRVE
jgi:hypothetical protein